MLVNIFGVAFIAVLAMFWHSVVIEKNIRAIVSDGFLAVIMLLIMIYAKIA